MSKTQLEKLKRHYHSRLSLDERNEFRAWVLSETAQDDTTKGIQVAPEKALTAVSITDDRVREKLLDEGFAEAASFFHDHYDPLFDISLKITAVAADLKANIVIKALSHQVDKIADLIRNEAASLGALLAEADPHNRALGARANVQYWQDFSRAWALYNAALDYVNNPNGDPIYQQRLIDEVMSNTPSSQRHYTMAKGATITRKRGPTQTTRERAELVKSFVDRGETREDAAVLANEQWAASHPEAPALEDTTFDSAYQRVYFTKNKQKKQLHLS